MLKAGCYCRVSRQDQDASIQQRMIREYCQRNDIEIFNFYVDLGQSGKKASRPAFNDLLADMRHYRFNCIVVTKLDRIGRSLQHILSLFDEFAKLGVHFIATSQAIDTSSSIGKFQLQMLGAVAEFERNLISERTIDGLVGKANVGKRGKDKKPRQKRGVLRARLEMVSK